MQRSSTGPESGNQGGRLDLRGILETALADVECLHALEEGVPFDCTGCQAGAVLARLSQPDVLDEFERRCEGPIWARIARNVLLHMLREER
jgi:hypothetical protein